MKGNDHHPSLHELSQSPSFQMVEQKIKDGPEKTSILPLPHEPGERTLRKPSHALRHVECPTEHLLVWRYSRLSPSRSQYNHQFLPPSPSPLSLPDFKVTERKKSILCVLSALSFRRNLWRRGVLKSPLLAYYPLSVIP